MGLDMFLYGEMYFTGLRNRRIMEDGFEVSRKRLKVGYWRNHPDLHGYIIENFAKRQDQYKSIDLDENDIYQIIKAIKQKKLPRMVDSYFSEEYITIQQIQKDIDVFTKAVKWLTEEKRDISKFISYRGG